MSAWSWWKATSSPPTRRFPRAPLERPVYLRLVGEAVSEFRGDEDTAPTEMKIELPVNAHLPHDYVPGERLRLDAYRTLAQASDEDGIREVEAELQDRFGELPEPARLLLEVARLRVMARSVGLSDIAVQGPSIRFAPADLPESKQMRLQRMHPGSKIVPVPGADASGARQVLIPKPKTARVGGKDLTDAAVIDWARQVLVSIFEAQEPQASSSAAQAQSGSQ